MSSWLSFFGSVKYAAAAKSLQSCPTLCDPRDSSPPGSAILGILRAKNTEVGCHFLLQCMKMKSESGVAQLCQTLSDPMDCSLPGSPVHAIFQARILEWGAIAYTFKIFLIIEVTCIHRRMKRDTNNLCLKFAHPKSLTIKW